MPYAFVMLIALVIFIVQTVRAAYAPERVKVRSR